MLNSENKETDMYNDDLNNRTLRLLACFVPSHLPIGHGQVQ